MSTSSHQSYRSDIDGLRALAVLSVILFHVDKRLLPGGFVGVDIFFVISGFLITRNIVDDLEKRRFSIAEFYRRRIKRIVPPMLLVVGLTFVAAQLLLLPEDAERVAESALWAILSLGNAYFWLHQDTGYFAAASNELPLLHLWSLGVEEQFYLIWPLVLLGLVRSGRSSALLGLSVMVAAISFTLGELFFQRDPSFAYYMLPSRAGELLVGALVALGTRPSVSLPWHRHWSTVGACMGVVLVVGSLGWLSEEGIFPGIRALPPTVGTALLILSGHAGSNPFTRLLSLRPLVAVGLISYSAYLWHWPLLAFMRYGGHEPSLASGAAVIVLTLTLAAATYWAVERPARAARGSFVAVAIRQFALPATALAAMIVGAMKADGYGVDWFSPSYRGALTALKAELQPAFAYSYVCQRQQLAAADLSDQRCVLGPGEGQPRVLLWGDSNAAHFVGVIGEFANAAGFRFRNVAIGSCPPLLEAPGSLVSARRQADCDKAVGLVEQALQGHDVVIVSASWTGYIGGFDAMWPAVERTVLRLVREGKRVVLVGKVPVISNYDRRCREKALRFPATACDVSEMPMDPETAAANLRLAQFAEANPEVGYFEASDALCARGMCSAYESDGRPMYYDASHIAMDASWRLGQRIVREHGVPAVFRSIAASGSKSLN